MGCVFCNLDKCKIVEETENTFTIFSDPFLVKGHCLVIPIKHYRWVSREKIMRVFDRCKFDVDGKSTAWMGHIAGNDTKHNEEADMLYIDKEKGLLGFKCRDEETANKCTEYWRLGRAFLG